MIGHSVGEFVAACLAGVFTLEGAITVVSARGRLMQQLPSGAMLAVAMAEEGLSSLLSDDVSLAALNGPSNCVVAGPKAAVAAFEQRLAERTIQCRYLQTSHAFHSSMMDPILEQFTKEVRKVRLLPPSIPVLSSCTGKWITQAEATDHTGPCKYESPSDFIPLDKNSPKILITYFWKLVRDARLARLPDIPRTMSRNKWCCHP